MSRYSKAIGEQGSASSIYILQPHAGPFRGVLSQIRLHAALSIPFELQQLSLPLIIVSEDDPIGIYVTAM